MDPLSVFFVLKAYYQLRARLVFNIQGFQWYFDFVLFHFCLSSDQLCKCFLDSMNSRCAARWLPLVLQVLCAAHFWRRSESLKLLIRVQSNVEKCWMLFALFFLLSNQISWDPIPADMMTIELTVGKMLMEDGCYWVAIWLCNPLLTWSKAVSGKLFFSFVA